jgi:regulator of chromosome condensation
MSWRIRINTASSVALKQYQIRTLSSTNQLNHSWNTSKIQFNLTTSMPNVCSLKSKRQTVITHPRLNAKRCLSKEDIPVITVDKKQKIPVESPSFVLVCGQNICGQLGLSTTIIERRKPQHLKIVNKLNMNENIQYIYAGAMHSCALTVTGCVYTWGCNDDGALGRITNDIDDEYIPGLFVLPEEIQTLCAGDSFTIALAKSGRVYISGCFRNNEGILGLFEYKQIAHQPIIIPLDQSIKQIACGADFCLLLTENGSILYSNKKKKIIFALTR